MHQVVRTAIDVCEADFAAKRSASRSASWRHATRSWRLAPAAAGVVEPAQEPSKFTPAGGSIRVETRDSQPLLIAVTDSGIGSIAVAAADLRCLRPGSDWVTSEFGGLGLACDAKATIEAHHGTLGIEPGAARVQPSRSTPLE